MLYYIQDPRKGFQFLAMPAIFQPRKIKSKCFFIIRFANRVYIRHTQLAIIIWISC